MVYHRVEEEKPKPRRDRSWKSKNRFPIPLYKRLLFPDNHTGPNFLADLEINPNIRTWTLDEAIEKSTRFGFQLSASILFFVLYNHLLNNEDIVPHVVTYSCWITSVTAHFIFQIHRYWGTNQGLRWFLVMFPRGHITVTMIYAIFTYQLSPLLRTLTETISTDTINAASFLMVVAHLLTHDYGVPGFFVSKTISINTAIIGAICLASRLPSESHSLALLTIAVQCFALFPMFSTMLWDTALGLAIIVSAVSYACLTISINYVLSYLILILFVNGVIPVIFIRSQKYKYNVYGPWDEAVPDLSYIEKVRASQDPDAKDDDITTDSDLL